MVIIGESQVSEGNVGAKPQPVCAKIVDRYRRVSIARIRPATASNGTNGVQPVSTITRLNLSVGSRAIRATAVNASDCCGKHPAPRVTAVCEFSGQ
jgi:hypothetical protein